ncbi:MAG: glycine betaine ABC transporter substrate-binding protein [Blastocatellia bacterium]
MNRRSFLLGISLSLLASACQGGNQNSLVIGSKNFTESIILAELFAQLIESTTKQNVTRKFNLGGTLVCHQALIAGQIDIYPEYTGTALMAILQEPPQSDPKTVYQIAKQAYESKFNATMAEPLGFNNTFAILVRGEDARKLNLTTISQATKYTPDWQAGFGYEFMSRADGFEGFSAKYQLKFKQAPKEMDLALTYRALAEKQVDLVVGNSTDGLISSLDLFILEDDQNYFPPYQAVPVIYQETLKRFPNLKKTLNKLAGKVTESEIQKLNALVDVDHRDVAEVVKEFLVAKNL